MEAADKDRQVVWRILDFRYWSESPNISIYRAIVAPWTHFIANERVILVEHRRRIPRLFQLETRHVSLCFKLKQTLVNKA